MQLTYWLARRHFQFGIRALTVGSDVIQALKAEVRALHGIQGGFVSKQARLLATLPAQHAPIFGVFDWADQLEATLG